MQSGRDNNGKLWEVDASDEGIVWVDVYDGNAFTALWFTPDQAREFIEAIHFAIIDVEGTDGDA